MEATNEYRLIRESVSRYEALGAYRLEITATIDDTLKSIDAQRKEAKASTALAFTMCPDVVTAVNLANMLAPSFAESVTVAKDDAARKRLQRRRVFLVNVLAGCFPAYDFETKKQGRNGAFIVAKYIGDAATRQANELLASVTRCFALLGIDGPEVSRDNLASAIKAEKAGCYVMTDPLQDTRISHLKTVRADFADFRAAEVTAADSAGVSLERAAAAAAAAAKEGAIQTAAAAAADHATAALDEMNVPTTKAGKKAAAALEKTAAAAAAAALGGHVFAGG